MAVLLQHSWLWQKSIQAALAQRFLAFPKRDQLAALRFDFCPRDDAGATQEVRPARCGVIMDPSILRQPPRVNHRLLWFTSLVLTLDACTQTPQAEVTLRVGFTGIASPFNEIRLPTAARIG